MKKITVFLILYVCTFMVHAQYWNLTGNGNTTSSHFVGTTDNKPIVFKTNGTERIRLLGDETNFGIGTSTPIATLHLHNPSNYVPTITSSGDSTHAKANCINYSIKCR